MGRNPQQASPLWALMVMLLSGCGATAGSEQAARDFLAAEFSQWMAGQANEVSTMHSRLASTNPPIGYDIRSVVADDPDPLAFDKSRDLPEGWESWPAYRVNVAVEFQSQAGTPVEKVATYTLTWNSHEQKWYVNERLF